jgi:hypothetical protein
MALLAAGFALGASAAALAETTMSGSQQTALLQYAVSHLDSETRTLAGLKNQIPSHEVVTVPVGGLTIAPTQRSTMMRGMTTGRHAALVAALSKATVADVDRNNGQSADQSSLAEYLQHLNVNPNTVVAVDVNLKVDRDNPHVTVFYRK